MYLRVTLLSGSSPQHASYYKPCDVTFTADLCENLNRRVVGKFRVSRHFVESYAQGDTSFRTISVVQSIQQHSAPNSKRRFRSRILLLSQFQRKSISKLGLCCDTIGISAATPRRFRFWRVAENGNHNCASPSQGLTRSRPCQGDS